MSITFRTRRSRILLVAVALAVAVLVVTYSRPESKAASEAPSKEVAAVGESSPVSVTVAVAAAREVPSYLEATGSLNAREATDVSSLVSGRIAATPVDVGALVRQGDVIARLDDQDARLRLRQAEDAVAKALAGVRQAEARVGLRSGGSFEAAATPEAQAAGSSLAEAEAQLRLAEAEEARYRRLVDTGVVARSQYDQVRTQVETARARVNTARQQREIALNTARQSNEAVGGAEADLGAARSQLALAQKAVADTVVRAPFSGRVSSRPVAVGEYVTPASVLATVLRTDTLKLQLQVPEAEVPFITPGMAVILEVDAHGERKFSGRVTAVNPAVDPASRAAAVEAEVENVDYALRPGMFATARITRPGGAPAVFVPRTAILEDRNTQSFRAFVIEGDTAKLRVVQIGDEEDGLVRILSGVENGEQVATSGLEQLHEGARVSL